MVHVVVLACVLRATTKKDRQLFRGKSAPPEKVLATPMRLLRILSKLRTFEEACTAQRQHARQNDCNCILLI